MKSAVAIVFILFYLISIAQNNDLPSFAEPGKCYVQSITHDFFESKDTTLFVYTGNKTGVDLVKYVEIVIDPGTTKWVKDTVNSKCDVPYEDCFIWKLVKFPKIFEAYHIVTDTNCVKNFKEVSITQKVYISIGGRSVWAEVLCEKQARPKLIRKLKRKLIELNYLKKSKITGIMDKKTDYAFMQYQIEHGFPPAKLEITTLRHLGLHF